MDICIKRNTKGFKLFGHTIKSWHGDFIICEESLYCLSYKFKCPSIFEKRELVPKFNIVIWENGHISPVRHIANYYCFSNHLFLDSGDIIIDKLNTLENDSCVRYSRYRNKKEPDQLWKTIFYNFKDGFPTQSRNYKRFT